MAIPDPWIPTDDRGRALQGREATPVRVRRYDAEAGFGETLTEVVAVEVRDGLGPDPGVARLRYRFTGLAAPRDAFEAVSTATAGTQVIRTGDRVVIEACDPAGSWHPIFDGFAYGFELQAEGHGEAANVTCVGVASKCYNTPVGGAIYRPGPDYDDKDKYVTTDVVAHFNPRGEGNRLPDAFQPMGNASKYCPLFVDVGAKMPDPDDPDTKHTPSTWGVHEAAAYILYTSNDQTFVANPLRADIDEHLQAHVPKTGQEFDPAQPGSYDVKPIAVADKPASGKAWPTLLHQVIGDKGFTFRWSLSADTGGNPATAIELLRTDTLPSKSVYLQARGSDLDPLLSNMSRTAMVRDVTEAINTWTVEGELTEHEASFVLAAGFPCSPSDAADTTALDDFNTSKKDPREVDADKYRTFIFDEAGEGHWAPGDGSTAKKTEVASLDEIFGEPVNDGHGFMIPRYAVRRRKPYAELVSIDDDGKPLKTRLDYSTDYRADEMQKVAFAGTPSGGSFTLSATLGQDVRTTAAIPYNASASQVQTALEALDGVEAGDVAVSGSVANGFTVAFTKALGAQPQTLMTPTGSLTGATVSTSRDHAGASGAVPSVWDGTGTWHEVTTGTWHLLEDRIGFRFTGKNPNAWHVASGKDDVLKLVEALAKPTSGNPKVTFRLTCVVRSDQRVKGTADRPENNARPDTLARVVDAHDRYQKRVICKNSKYNLLSDDIADRDDSELAKSEAQAMQFVTQAGVLDGSVTIPYLTAYYRPGDRISDVNGRSLSLRTDGMGSGSTPVYPIVVRRTWRLDGEQRTILELSDASTARAGYMRRGHGRFAHQNYLGNAS